ncbi:MAG: PAS domain-containing protein [Dongiaceae bacterium]
MKTPRRLLPGADGSLLAEGEKAAALELFGRLSNATQAVYETWCQARRGSALPRREDLSLRNISAFQPNILIVDVLPETRDYRYRVVGWREIEARGSDPTGMTVRQCYSGEGLDFVLQNYELVVAGREPFVDLSVEVTASQRYVETETLFLPLSEDGVSVTQVLVYRHFLDQPRSTSVEPSL